MVMVIETSTDVFAELERGRMVPSADGEFIISSDTLIDADMTEAERNAYSVYSVEAAGVPTGKTMVDKSYARQNGVVVQVLDLIDNVPVPPSALEFMLRFTADERAAIRASADLQVQDFMDLCRAAQYVDASNPLVTQGMALLVSETLLTQARSDAILSA